MEHQLYLEKRIDSYIEPINGEHELRVQYLNTTCQAAGLSCLSYATAAPGQEFVRQQRRNYNIGSLALGTSIILIAR